MATYNGERFLEQQLLSLQKQTRTVDEVIIMDDCSTDQTTVIVTEFIQKHQLDNWKFCTNKTNQGFIGNFFNAIEETTGDIIFFCDQDDEWFADKIEKMTEIMEKNPNILALNSAVKLIDEEGKSLDIKQKKGYCNENILHKALETNTLTEFSFEYIVKTNISPGCTMCIRKELKEKALKYKEKCIEAKFPHDWFMNLIASMEKGTYFFNKPFTGYRMHGNNTIGVNTQVDEDKVTIKSTKQLREDIGEFHFRRATFIWEEMQLNFENRAYIEKYLTFTRKRYIFLKELSFGKFLCLYRYPKMYYDSIGKKGMISDFIYALKLDTVLRKK